MAFTFFFRDRQTLDQIAEHVIPDLKKRRYIDVWDAGCAMGPEPYSLAIIFRENMGHFLFRNVRIFATDIDESGDFGETIANGVYPADQVKRVPSAFVDRYFGPNGDAYHVRISDEIRKSVAYERHDLLSLRSVRQELGLIVCKNVLLHFAQQERIDVIRMFHKALSQDGYFATEQTQKLPQEVEHLFRRVTDSSQLFQKA